MNRVTSLACIFDTKTQAFSIELVHGDEDARVRFPVGEPAALEALLEAYDDCSAAHFDAGTGELAFDFGDVDDERASDEDDDHDDDVAGDGTADDEDEEEPARAAG